MSIGLLGQNLAFLIFQPSTGPTRLRRILGNCPDIYTESEPRLLLHPFYALRPEGYQAELECCSGGYDGLPDHANCGGLNLDFAGCSISGWFGILALASRHR